MSWPKPGALKTWGLDQQMAEYHIRLFTIIIYCVPHIHLHTKMSQSVQSENSTTPALSMSLCIWVYLFKLDDVHQQAQSAGTISKKHTEEFELHGCGNRGWITWGKKHNCVALFWFPVRVKSEFELRRVPRAKTMRWPTSIVERGRHLVGERNHSR